MKARFLSVARTELVEAVRYYELQRTGLGGEFRDAVRDAVNRIKAFPAAWHPLDETIRRCQVHRFPYGVIYSPLASEIVLIAVAHLHREPDYWRERIK